MAHESRGLRDPERIDLLHRHPHQLGTSHFSSPVGDRRRPHVAVVVLTQMTQRGVWELSRLPLHSVIKALCEALSGISHRPIVVVAKPTSVVVPRVPGEEPKDAILDAKGQVAIGFQTLGYHLTRVYGYGATKLWLDSDRTKIPWVKGKTQANLTRSPFMDLGSDIEPPKFEPIIETGPKPRLLEIADLYAYITAQAHMAGVVGSIGGFKNSIP